MMDPSTVLLEKIPITVPLAFEGLDELEFQTSCLHERLADADVFGRDTSILNRAGSAIR